MIGRLRKWLQTIRYYQGGKRSTRWTAASDIAFIAALVLALPAVFISEQMFMRSVATSVYGGQLYVLPDGSSHSTAEHGGPEVTSVPIPEQARIEGTWSLRIEDRRYGFPVATRVDRPPAVLDLNFYSEPAIREDAQLSLDDPWRNAIQQALAVNGFQDATNAWNTGTTRKQRFWLGWIGGGLLWWMALTIVGGILVQILRVIVYTISEIRRLHRLNRELSGQCPKCGYDMTGLDFNERCPECGSLVY